MALRHMIRARHLNRSPLTFSSYERLIGSYATGVQAKKTALSCWPHPQMARQLSYIAYKKCGVAHAIYNVEEQKRFYCNDQLPHCFANQELMQTKYGWSIMRDRKTGEFTLFNYDSMESIHVPAPPTLPPPMCEGRRFQVNLTFIANITSAPTDKNCILVLYYLQFPFIKFCYLRDKEWFIRSYKRDFEDRLRNVLVIDGNMYGSTVEHNLVQLVFADSKFSFKHISKMQLYPFFVGKNICRLVESDGELYSVEIAHFLNGWTKIRTIMGFGIYKMNLSKMCLEEVKSIGERVFFLDHTGDIGEQISFLDSTCDRYNYSHVAKKVGLTQDCIHYEIDNHKYRYNLANRGITLLLSIDEDRSIILPQCLKSTILDDSLTLMESLYRKFAEKFDLNTREVVESSVIEEDQRPLKQLLEQNSPCFLSFSNDYNTISLIDPVHNVRQLIPSPGIPFNKILSSKFGCLLLMTRDDTQELQEDTEERHRVFFYNPLTKEIIDLPHFEFEFTHFYHFSFSNPPTSNHCTVVAVQESCWNISLVMWQRGETNWTEMNSAYNDDYFGFLAATPVFHRDKFYFMGWKGMVGVFDPVMRSCVLSHNYKKDVDR